MRLPFSSFSAPSFSASVTALLFSLLGALALAAGCAKDPTDPGTGPGTGGSGGGSPTGGSGGNMPPVNPGKQQTPFGSRSLKYPAGTVVPSGGNAALDAAVTSFYDRWKAAYLQPLCGGHVVKTGGGTGADDAMTVSEGHGYGMIVTAVMAGHDPRAQELFDGLYKVFRQMPSSINRE